MFRWYKQASICYAYLQDVNVVNDLETSRWFTRGWTLQELLAPRDVAFYSASWHHLGSKIELRDVLWKITGIEPVVLEHGSLSNVTVVKKMVGLQAAHTLFTITADNTTLVLGREAENHSC